MKTNDQILLEQAYNMVYIKEEAPSYENIKIKIKNFVAQYGQKVKEIIQKKFPEFHQKLIATKGNEQQIKSLIEPLINKTKTLSPPVEEGIFGDIINKLFSYNTLGQLLIAVGSVAIMGADALIKGPSLDPNLLIIGIVSFLVGLYAANIEESPQKQP